MKNSEERKLASTQGIADNSADLSATVESLSKDSIALGQLPKPTPAEALGGVDEVKRALANGTIVSFSAGDAAEALAMKSEDNPTTSFEIEGSGDYVYIFPEDFYGVEFDLDSDFLDVILAELS